MPWWHDPDPWDVEQAAQLGESAKAPSKASLRPPSRHFQPSGRQLNSDRLLASPLLDRIVSQSDGVPLFIEELTRAVLETPDLDAAGTAIPTTLQASLMARLDRLPAARQVAQIGAVIGREFPHALLEMATARLSDVQLAPGLEQLIAAGLMF